MKNKEVVKIYMQGDYSSGSKGEKILMSSNMEWKSNL